MSQNDDIESFLKKGRSITQVDALKLFGCFRLASRIYDLRERGLEIDAIPMMLKNGKRVTKYRLAA